MDSIYPFLLKIFPISVFLNISRPGIWTGVKYGNLRVWEILVPLWKLQKLNNGSNYYLSRAKVSAIFSVFSKLFLIHFTPQTLRKQIFICYEYRINYIYNVFLPWWTTTDGDEFKRSLPQSITGSRKTFPVECHVPWTRTSLQCPCHPKCEVIMWAEALDQRF